MNARQKIDEAGLTYRQAIQKKNWQVAANQLAVMNKIAHDEKIRLQSEIKKAIIAKNDVLLNMLVDEIHLVDNYTAGNLK